MALFLKSLNKEVNSIKRSPNLFISADKTSNIYEMKEDDYKKLLKENVTKGYKKTKPSEVKDINRKAKEIACSLKLDNIKSSAMLIDPHFFILKIIKKIFLLF